MTNEAGQMSIPGGVNLLKLVTIGRKTSLPHIVLLRFVWANGSFYVLAGHQNSDWVRNAIAFGSAKVRIGEYVYDARPQIATEAETVSIKMLFEAKYGKRMIVAWYPKSTACLKLNPIWPPRRRASLRGEGEARLSFGEWKRSNSNYYVGVAEAFDSASEEYDFTINQNYINRWIRKRSIQELVGLTHPNDTLLEIGCGTGAEALEVSKYVARIVATDISEKMIEILSRKIAARGLETKIIPARLGAMEVSKVLEMEGRNMNLAYSFNGALNCEPAIGNFPRELAKVIDSGGYFVCSIRNTICLSEILSHTASFQFGKTNPRKKQPIMISVGGRDIPSVYYSASEFARHFTENFELKKTVGLPAILPPAYLSNYYVRLGFARTIIERLERGLSDKFPFNRLGDQTLFVFQRM